MKTLKTFVLNHVVVLIFSNPAKFCMYVLNCAILQCMFFLPRTSLQTVFYEKQFCYELFSELHL